MTNRKLVPMWSKLGAVLCLLGAALGCESGALPAECPEGMVISPLLGCVDIQGDANPCGPGTVWNGSLCVPDADVLAALEVSIDVDLGSDAATTGDGSTGSDSTVQTDGVAESDVAVVADADVATDPDTAVGSDTGADTDVVSVPDASPGTDAAASTDASAGTDAIVLDIPPTGPCVPDCTGKECGADGCGGVCGSCQFVAGKPYCSPEGMCVSMACVPDCTDKECGPDGCGGSCGGCPVGKGCTLHYCQNLAVGDSCEEYCGGFAPSGCSCEPGCEGVTCCPDVQAACGCKPQCDGKSCGPDGCGGNCGTCGAGTLCSATGQCDDDPCLPDPCNAHGTCASGACTCQWPYAGAACDTCAAGMIGYPDCKADPCLNQNCSGHGTCSSDTGACTCNPGFATANCGKCEFASQTYPDCSADPCSGVECAFGKCDPTSGACLCFPGYKGTHCDACASQDDSFPDCGGSVAGQPALTGLECGFCAAPLAEFVTPTEPGDATPPSVLLSIPSEGVVVGPNTPIIVLLDDYVDASSVTNETFVVKLVGSDLQLQGSIVAQGTKAGQTVLIFFPKGLDASGVYSVAINGVKDTSGNALFGWSVSFSIDAGLAGDSKFVNNRSFEGGLAGCVAVGDVLATPGSGDLMPSNGSSMLAMSTGDVGSGWTLGSGNSATADRASMVVCGPMPIPAGATKLRFDVDFGSSEYDAFVGQIYDDLAIAAIAGPNGGAGGVLMSVNAGAEGAVKGSGFGLPDPAFDGDSIFRHTGTKTVEIGNIGVVGDSITVVLAVTDVADTSYPSLLTLDNVRFDVDFPFATNPILANLQCDFCAGPLAGFEPPVLPNNPAAPKVLVSIPPPQSIVGPNTPVVLIVDQPVAPTSVTADSFAVLAPDGVTKLKGSLVAQSTQTGQTALIFFPEGGVPGGQYTLSLDGAEGTNGVPVEKWLSTFSVNPDLASTSPFADNLGFESGAAGCVLAGDVTVTAGSGSMMTSEGSSLLALSTGQMGDFSFTEVGALDQRVSLVLCGPFAVPKGATSLMVDYNFGSTEYDQFVGQAYDDLVLAAVSGTNGGAGGVLTSVNAAVEIVDACTGFGLPSAFAGDGDQIFRCTSQKTMEIGNIASVGSSVLLLFAVVDVADASYPSLVTVDNVRFSTPP